MTATPQMNNVEQTICTLSSVEQSRIGGLTIAELRSRFQKDSDIVSGPGKSSSGTTSSRGNMVRCSPDRVEKTRVSLSLSSSEARDFKEKIHKFDNFLQEQVSADSHALRTLPQKSGRLAASCDSSKIGSEAFNTDIGSSGNTMEEIVVAEKAVTDHKWKPVVPSKSPKRIQTGSSSHYKSPKPLPPPRDNPKNNLNDVDEHNSIYERRRRSPNLSPQFSIKPNPSHLSTLISEVQKQQQQLMSKKIGFSNSRQESGITDSDFKGQSSQSLECVSSTCPAPHELKQMSLNCGSSLELTTITYLSKLWKPKRLPSLKVLGLPPQKPTKPPKTLSTVIVVPPKIGATPPLPNRNPSMNSSAPDLCLASTNVAALPQHGQTWNAYTKEEQSALRSSSSPIPEFTEEEELGSLSSPTELYDDTMDSSKISIKIPMSSTSSQSHTLLTEDLYHDTVTDEHGDSDDLYEDVGVIEKAPSDSGSFTYGSKDGESKKKENDKKLKKQQRENEKRFRETEKQRKKFNLTGNEVAVDVGFVKETVKGRWRDNLAVNKGDMISILRVSNNPVGKWLARNEEGKVGYVDITNIEVDASSIRYPQVLHHEAIPLVDKHIPLPDKLQNWLSRLTLCVSEYCYSVPSNALIGLYLAHASALLSAFFHFRGLSMVMSQSKPAGGSDDEWYDDHDVQQEAIYEEFD